MAVTEAQLKGSVSAEEFATCALAFANGVALADFVESVAGVAKRALASADFDTFDGCGALAAAKSFDSLVRVASAGKTLATGRAAHCNVGARSGTDTTSFLAAQTGESSVEVSRRIQTARKLQELSETRDALIAGNLSSSQVDAVARGAVDSQSEKELLTCAANQPLRELQTQSRRFAQVGKSVQQQELRRRRAQAMRSAFFELDPADPSMYRGFIKGPAQDLAVLQAKVKAAQARVFRAAQQRAKAGEPQESFKNHTYDAVFGLLNSAPLAPDPPRSDVAPRNASFRRSGEPDAAFRNAGGVSDGCAGDAVRAVGSGGRPDAQPVQIIQGSLPLSGVKEPYVLPMGDAIRGGGESSVGCNTNVRHQVHIHITEAAFHSGVIRRGDFCEDSSGASVSLARIYDILDQTNPVVRLLVKRGNRVTATATTDGRKIMAETWAIAVARDPVCANPACGSPVNVQIDHRRPVKDGGPPTLNNLVGLCSKCHKLKTYQGWCLVGPRGSWVFVKRRLNGDGGIGYPLDRDEDPSDYLDGG